MEFAYVIVFYSTGHTVTRTGKGLFYPHDGGFNLEHMLWQMTEEFGRPTDIEVYCKFRGDEDGKTASKRLESAKAEKARASRVSHE